MIVDLLLQTEPPSDPIIYKITTEQFRFLKKFADFVNYQLDQRFGALYLEPIKEGFLFIVKDEAFFHRINQKLTPEIREYIKKFVPSDNSLINVGDIIDESDFPKEGFRSKYEAQNDLSIKLMPEFIEFYQSMIPEIKVINITQDSFEIRFETYESYKFRMNLIYISSIAH